VDLQRQYHAMRDACEALRLMDENGISVTENVAAAERKNVGRLYRVAMEKKSVWGADGGFPIDYARNMTDYPSRTGWDHEWTRN
jgi:large subunit ribosomal protein L40